MDLTSIVIIAVGIIAQIIPLWMVLRKCGYHGAWSLVSLVPLVNLIALWHWALADWPGAKPKAGAAQ